MTFETAQPGSYHRAGEPPYSALFLGVAANDEGVRYALVADINARGLRLVDPSEAWEKSSGELPDGLTSRMLVWFDDII